MAQKTKSFTTCNIASKTNEATELRSYAIKGQSSQIQKSFSVNQDEAFPPVKFDKTWKDSFQPKLNVGLIPSQFVFLQIIELPTTDASEIPEMLELQLERISPIPPAQIFWNFYVISNAGTSNEQSSDSSSVLVLIAEQKVVYQYIEDLQSRNFYPDIVSSDLMMHFASPEKIDVIQVIPSESFSSHTCLVLWWFDGALKHISQISAEDKEKLLSQVEQDIKQTFWSGQMDGWASHFPAIEIQCPTESRAEWTSFQESISETQVRFRDSDSDESKGKQLATLFGNQSVRADLLPEDTRKANKNRQFDSTWMTALGCAVILYLMGLGFYFVFLNQAQSVMANVNDQIDSVSVTYTNAMKLDERIRITESQLKLRFAALETWKSVVDSLPTELTFKQFKFSKRETLLLNGQGPIGANGQVNQYVDTLTDLKDLDGNKLFEKVERKSIQNSRGVMNWTIQCTFPI